MRKKRAIVFDDDHFILIMFKKFFSSCGYEVLTFNEPTVCPVYEKQTEQCDKEYPCADIVITDFEMPKMNGIELLMHQTNRGCRLTIKNKAVISGSLDEENRKKIEELGGAFFQKPLNFDELTNWIDACEKRIDPSQPVGALE
jgi:DNA-binding response OmpR family regulator